MMQLFTYLGMWYEAEAALTSHRALSVSLTCNDWRNIQKEIILKNLHRRGLFLLLETQSICRKPQTLRFWFRSTSFVSKCKMSVESESTRAAIVAMQQKFIFRCYLNGLCAPYCSFTFLVIFIFSRGQLAQKSRKLNLTSSWVLMSSAHTHRNTHIIIDHK